MTGRGRDALLALVGGVMGASVAVLATDLPPVLHPATSPVASSTSAAPPASNGHRPLPPALPPAGSTVTPVQIKIPAIQLSARIEAVGVDQAGSMGVPKDIHDTAWYRNGPAPGQPGDAVIDGHLDWYTGPAVFWNLGKLKPGDGIFVGLSNGRTVKFKVASLKTYPYTAKVSGLFATSGRPELSLITCAGQWDAGRHIYASRLVVDASVVG